MATEEKKVKKRDDKVIYGTGSSKFLAKGKEYKVHSVLAETLVKKGAAVYNKADVQKAAKASEDNDSDLLGEVIETPKKK